MLIAGREDDTRSLAYYEALFEAALRRAVPALCINPDLFMLTETGTAFGVGRIAQAYREWGGTITWVGKPYPDIYEQALRAIAPSSQGRVIGVGDSPAHDIAGAHAADCRAALGPIRPVRRVQRGRADRRDP